MEEGKEEFAGYAFPFLNCPKQDAISRLSCSLASNASVASGVCNRGTTISGQHVYAEFQSICARRKLSSVFTVGAAGVQVEMLEGLLEETGQRTMTYWNARLDDVRSEILPQHVQCDLVSSLEILGDMNACKFQAVT